jgi:hypothetical protein
MYYMTPRGIRNHNPLNLREDKHGGDQWDGEALLNLDASFEEFKSPVWGIRAGAKVLRNYQRLHGLNTVSDIINRFAPPTENITTSYIDHVAKKLNVSPFDPINLNNHDTLKQLVSAVIKHENGVNPYTEAVIDEAISMALA